MIIINEINSLKPEEKRWTKWDLHHHTYLDKPYEKRNRRRIKLKNTADIISAFIENINSNSAIAITDHDRISIETVNGYREELKNKKILEKLKTKKEDLNISKLDINIFPGVELRFKIIDEKGKEKKVDIILIFRETLDDNQMKKINDILSKVYLTDVEISNNERKDLQFFVNVIIKIQSEGFDFISMPHFLGKANGADQKYDKKLFWELMMYFDLLETKMYAQNHIKNITKRANYFNEIRKIEKTFIQGTDAHDISEFKQNLNKLPFFYGDNNFNGLKKIVEYNRRIKEDTNDKQIATIQDYISEIKISKKGSHKTETIYFDKGVNCIVGRKNTGKSYLIQNIKKTIEKKENDDGYEFNIIPKGIVAIKNVKIIQQGEIAKAIFKLPTQTDPILNTNLDIFQKDIINKYMSPFIESKNKINNIIMNIADNFNKLYSDYKKNVII